MFARVECGGDWCLEDVWSDSVTFSIGNASMRERGWLRVLAGVHISVRNRELTMVDVGVFFVEA